MEPPLKTFSPLPVDPAYVAFPDNAQRYRQEAKRTSWSCLSILSDPTFNSHIPYAWGFIIYRVRFRGDSDERFYTALRRFEQWAGWIVRAVRYGNDNLHDLSILPDGTEPTDQLAERLYNQVLEFIPGNEPVVTEPEGEEDFSAVGVAFSKWVSSLPLTPDNASSPSARPNARYDQCLIIDKAALESLENLSETPPALEHYSLDSPHNAALHALYYSTWVWVLDRRTNEALGAGENLNYSPWVRLRICSLQDLWFHGPRRVKPQEWRQLAEEDKHKWETVRWWNAQALLVNSARRQTRGRTFASFMDMYACHIIK